MNFRPRIVESEGAAQAETQVGQEKTGRFAARSGARLGAAELVGLALACVAGPALAASSAESVSPQTADSAAKSTAVAAPQVQVLASYSYVGSSKSSFYGTGPKADAQTVNAAVLAEMPVNDDWFIPVGVQSFNGFFGGLDGLPAPDGIHTLGIGAGVGRRIDERWTVSATVGPQFYRLEDMDSSAIGFGGVVRAVYRWRPNVTLALGLGIQPDRDVPVLPAMGMRWDINTNWTLNLMFPKPEIIYKVNSDLDVFAGVGLNFAVFRADKDMGEKLNSDVLNPSRYNNALGTYRDFHLGAGVDYKLARGLYLSAEGGYSVGREFDYTRLDETLSFKPAPYVQTSIRWWF